MLLMLDVMLKFVRAFNCGKHLNGVVKKLSIFATKHKRGTLYHPDVFQIYNNRLPEGYLLS